MARALYLHEVVDVVGQGAVPYMEHTVGFHTAEAAGRGLELVGTWQVVGATGRWPQVVNLWELVDGFDGWRRLCDATNVRRAQNRALEEWWDEAYRHRSGGLDRLLAAAPGSPTLTDLLAAGVSGEVFTHEISTVVAGGAARYLEMVLDRRRPLMEEHGHRLVGAYEVLLRDTEVVTVWAASLADHVAWMLAAEPGGDERIPAFHDAARQVRTGWREELMTPGPGSPVGEPRRDGA